MIFLPLYFISFVSQVNRRQSTDMSSDNAARSPWTGVSQFLPTNQRIVQFSNVRSPAKGDKIVYVAGAVSRKANDKFSSEPLSYYV